MMIVYIKRDYGGAYKCYKYAQELGVPIMNIADKGVKKTEKQKEYYSRIAQRIYYGDCRQDL